jgi:hypothetical protein
MTSELATQNWRRDRSVAEDTQNLGDVDGPNITYRTVSRSANILTSVPGNAVNAIDLMAVGTRDAHTRGQIL